MAGTSPAVTTRSGALLRAILIRRNLDQAAEKIPAADRSQRAAGALFGDRAFLDLDPVGFQVRHHFVRALEVEEQTVAPGGFVVGGERSTLSAPPGRTFIFWLPNTSDRLRLRFARSRIEHLDFHAENLPGHRGERATSDTFDDEMVERVNPDRHALSFRRGRRRRVALAAPDFVCYNAGRVRFREPRLNRNGPGSRIGASKEKFYDFTSHRDLLAVIGLSTAAASIGSVSAAVLSSPVKWVVVYPPGGATDIIARLIGQRLSERLGQQFVIENKPGAGNNIATESVINAEPDGYTVLLVNPANDINATLYANLKFNLVRDIAPVAAFNRVPNVMTVNKDVPAKTVAEFIVYVKANPGKVNLASSGNGTSVHLSGEMFMAVAGAKMQHVPYRGAAPAITDLLGGQVQVIFDNMLSISARPRRIGAGAGRHQRDEVVAVA